MHLQSPVVVIDGAGVGVGGGVSVGGGEEAVHEGLTVEVPLLV